MPAGFGLKRQYSKYCGLVMVPLHSVYHTLNPRHATIGGERGRPPLPYFENRKKVPRFCKKCPDRDHLWVKFSIQNVILRISRIKNSNFSLLFFSNVFDKMFIKVPQSHETFPALKNFWLLVWTPSKRSRNRAMVLWATQEIKKFL